MEPRIKERYFLWLNDTVTNKEHRKSPQFMRILSVLHRQPFSYTIPMDVNRERDGIGMRWRFLSEFDEDDDETDYLVSQIGDPSSCSVLEVIVSLAVHCEEIMDDPELGNRTAFWFWSMIENMLGEDYETLDDISIETKVNSFLQRKYAPNGKGGLFYIPDCPNDLTQFELWTQMCWYLENK